MRITYQQSAAAAIVAETDLTANEMHDSADTFKTLLCELNEANAFSLPGAAATKVALELTQTATPDGDSHYDLEIALQRQCDNGQTVAAALRAGEYDDIVPLTGEGERSVLDTLDALVDLANAALRDLVQVLS